MDIENRIRQFILTNLYYAEDSFIGDEDSFLETGVIDSMGVMELVAFIQSEFAIEVAQQEIVVENFDSIRKLASFVRRKLPPTEPAETGQADARVADSAPLVGR
jgi:acyl carrier protein